MRPHTLAEAVHQHRAGRDFGMAIREFLDEFYLANTERQSLIDEEPALLGDPKLNAYLGAVGEHLAQRWRLDHIPPWTRHAGRFLDEPWFPNAESPRLRMILLMESPIAFRRRQIFTEIEPLRRASMPRDSRAIANENGIKS
jgi:hypothetical protein